MILNAYSVLDGFVAVLRGLAAVAVIGLSVSALRRRTGEALAETRQSREDRGYLLFQLAFLLLALNVASWPLLYLLLQSYVPEWPEVMCIYGVTRIGAGSHGPARFLPALVETLQWSKPLMVFLTGGWFALYAMNRRTQTAPLMNRVLLVLIVLGVVAAADAAVESAYLIIPKKEEFPVTGCCTAVGHSLSETSRLPAALMGTSSEACLTMCYYAVNLSMVLGLFCCVQSLRWEPKSESLTPLLLGALLTIAVNTLFLREVAAPTLLHLPYHHCVYDLIVQVPESSVGIALFYGGSFTVGWSCLIAGLAQCSETLPMLRARSRELLLLGLFGYLGSLVLMSVALAIE